MVNSAIIGKPYKFIIKPIFFKFDPEAVHDLIKTTGSILGKFAIARFITKRLFKFESAELSQTLAGLDFPNPIGLSAGFDKNAELLNILPTVGFGFAEIGSVTLKPYEGNPKPRLFRLIKSKAIVVYYGLMNTGVHRAVVKFKKSLKTDTIFGVSVAKTNSKDTATMRGGIQDYYECLKYLKGTNTGDYYTINVSCPNTFGGEPFTTPEKLESLLSRIDKLKISKPIFIKMPINLSFDKFDKLLQIIIKHQCTGVVIGNLTKVRDPDLIKDEIPMNIKGGISGKPTEKLSNDLIAYTYKNYKGKLIIIGVGGVFSSADAYKKIKLGASLVQLITGMIFQGPQLIGQINCELVQLLKQDGYNNIREAIGTAN